MLPHLANLTGVWNSGCLSTPKKGTESQKLTTRQNVISYLEAISSTKYTLQVTQPNHQFLAAPTQIRVLRPLSVRGRVSQLQEAVHEFQLVVKLHLLLHVAIGPVEAGLPKPGAVVVDRQRLGQRGLERQRLVEVGEEVRRQAVARLLGLRE